MLLVFKSLCQWWRCTFRIVASEGGSPIHSLSDTLLEHCFKKQPIFQLYCISDLSAQLHKC